MSMALQILDANWALLSIQQLGIFSISLHPSLATGMQKNHKSFVRPRK